MSDQENIELPKVVSIKIDTTTLDDDEIAALKAIYIRDRSKLPFSLPRIMSWPSKERANDKRALVLLKSGYLDLVEKSEKEKKVDQAAEPNRVGAEAKSQNSVTKDPEPRVRF
jgi:hypothetical protein